MCVYVYNCILVRVLNIKYIYLNITCKKGVQDLHLVIPKHISLSWFSMALIQGIFNCLLPEMYIKKSIQICRGKNPQCSYLVMALLYTLNLGGFLNMWIACL